MSVYRSHRGSRTKRRVISEVTVSCHDQWQRIDSRTDVQIRPWTHRFTLNQIFAWRSTMETPVPVPASLLAENPPVFTYLASFFPFQSGPLLARTKAKNLCL